MKVIINKTALTSYMNGNIRVSLSALGNDLVSSIRGSMWFGLGRRYKYKGKVHYASTPGMPPSVLEGRLHDSISYATSFGDKSTVGSRASSGDGMSNPIAGFNEQVLRVGSNVPYALTLEKGLKTRGLSPRPYLWPALSKGRETIKKAFSTVKGV